MRCVVCRGEDIRPEKVDEELKLGNDIVYVPILTPVCSACGERYYDRRTIRYLEGIEDKLKSGTWKSGRLARCLS